MKYLMLLIILLPGSAFAFFYDDYNSFGGPTYTSEKHAIILDYIIMPNRPENFQLQNYKTIKEITNAEVPYPYITFYKDPELKTIGAKIDEKGLTIDGKLVCSPRAIVRVAFLCPTNLMKFFAYSKDKTSWYVTIEYDRDLGNGLLETNHDGKKLYFKLADAVGTANKIKFNKEQMSEERDDNSELLKPFERDKEKIIKEYWIRPSSKSLREEFFANSIHVKNFFEKINQCIKKKDHKCLNRNSSGSVEEYFSHLYENFGQSDKTFGKWYYQTSSMLETLKKCLDEGEVTSVKQYTSRSTNGNIGRVQSIRFNIYSSWETGDKNKQDRLRCGYTLFEKKVGEEWIFDKILLSSDIVEYL